MPVRQVDRLQQADLDGVVRRPLQRRCDRVECELEVLPGTGDRCLCQRRCRDAFDAGVRGPLRGPRCRRRRCRSRRRDRRSGCGSHRGVPRGTSRNDEVRGDELAVGPQFGFVDKDLSAAFEYKSGRPRLGYPGAVQRSGLERRQGVGVVLWGDRDVAASARVGLVALSNSDAGSATSWVLPSDGLASSCRRDLLVSRCPRGRRATRRPRSCLPRCGARRRWSVRSR